MLLLAAATPFRAYDRRTRMRVFSACVAFTAAFALTSIIAMFSEPSGSNALSLPLPVIGALLAIWAYLTRNRRRMSGFGGYHMD